MITIHLPRRLVLSLNDRIVWQQGLRLKKDLRTLGYLRAHKHPTFDRARLDVTLSWPTRHRRDRHNYTPTIKHLIDGMVDAGILPDDDDTHLDGPMLHTSPDLCDKQHALVLTFDWQEITPAWARAQAAELTAWARRTEEAQRCAPLPGQVDLFAEAIDLAEMGREALA